MGRIGGSGINLGLGEDKNEALTNILFQGQTSGLAQGLKTLELKYVKLIRDLNKHETKKSFDKLVILIPRFCPLV